MSFQHPMIFLVSSAAFVGLVHSLAPGHWLPVVLMTKSRRWSLSTAILGALIASSGHILISNAIGLISIWVGAHFLVGLDHEQLERYAGILLMVFGAIYAVYSYKRHSHCHGHTHHGPHPPDSGRAKAKKGNRGPFLFLFSLGLSPCIAVLPVFAAASVHGTWATLFTMLAFSIGVAAALVGATVLTALGLMKLDHEIFEHYGDVITGLSVTAMGVVVYFFPL